MAARFSIGIDLGTTNSALAYVPLSGDVRPEALAVPQWESPAALAEATTLPSFLYLPENEGPADLPDRVRGAEEWIAGRLARVRAGETPGRVVRSAKSWLCHHSADRSAPILPWGSEDLQPEQKISPVRAAALILSHLRAAWDNRFAASGSPFDEQDLTITAPASFDAAAQRLTLDAAEEAGYPASVRLLEEPQAAFYCWLQQHGAAKPLWEGLDPNAAEPRHVLIVDIGGGTSDFSLFELRPGAPGVVPDIRRVAVSEHILLGGDNIDLALAALTEPRLVAERGRMSGPQWEHLVASCRDVKERALSGPGSSQEPYVVALPGRGSSLLAGARTATLTRDEVERLVLDGFFPACNARARPYRTQSGLRDWGLPYAADSAITRHLADFLRDRPRVDAVLFNGGSLHAAVLRECVLDQIAVWQDGARPIELENAEPDLAVARGAARFGKLLHGPAGRIAAGASQAVFLAAQTAPAATNPADQPALICVLPLNAPAEQAFEINLPGLELRTDQLVSFQAFSSTRHGRCRPGDVLPCDPDAFHALPPLQTIIRTEDGADAGSDRTIPIRLAAKMNALGLLQISCVGTNPQAPQSWPLEFNLRPHEQGGVAAQGGPAPGPVAPNATTEAQQAAREHIATLFTRSPQKSDRLTANAMLKTLERIIGLSRQEWNAALLRNLWPALNEQTMGRKLSVEHEEAWLTMAGFLLRPGFGFVHDGDRMDELWRLRDAGLCFPGKRSKVQEHILWRRVAGGLNGERQERLLAGELATIRADKASPELVRLAGSLERLPRETKADLIQTFIAQALARAEAKQHCAPHLAALGLLLNRAPLYAGPETVVAAEFVARTYAAFQNFDWAEPELMECCNLFLGAARVVNDRNLDVPKPLRNQIARKLESAGVEPTRTAPIKEFRPVGRIDRTSQYGESLPPGLVLGADLN
ncbi:MAG TPA: Hsp70 family protein [Roseiarcus sp.]|nr:Hsp70 family protein [Roseiarcus sp.]